MSSIHLYDEFIPTRSRDGQTLDRHYHLIRDGYAFNGYFLPLEIELQCDRFFQCIVVRIHERKLDAMLSDLRSVTLDSYCQRETWVDAWEFLGKNGVEGSYDILLSHRAWNNRICQKTISQVHGIFSALEFLAQGTVYFELQLGRRSKSGCEFRRCRKTHKLKEAINLD